MSGIQLTHATPATGSNNATKQVSVDVWNEKHSFSNGSLPLLICNGGLTAMVPFKVLGQADLGLFMGAFSVWAGNAPSEAPSAATSIYVIIAGVALFECVVVVYEQGNLNAPICAWQARPEFGSHSGGSPSNYAVDQLLFWNGVNITVGATYTVCVYTSVYGLSHNTTSAVSGLLAAGANATTGANNLYNTTIQGTVNEVDAVDTTQTDGGNITLSLNSTFKGVVNGNAANVTTLQNDLGSNVAIINGNAANITTLQGIAGGNAGNITTLQGSVGSLQTDVTALQNAVQALQVILTPGISAGTINDASITGGSNFNFGTNGTITSVT